MSCRRGLLILQQSHADCSPRGVPGNDGQPNAPRSEHGEGGSYLRGAVMRRAAALMVTDGADAGESPNGCCSALDEEPGRVQGPRLSGCSIVS